MEDKVGWLLGCVRLLSRSEGDFLSDDDDDDDRLD